MAFVGWEETCPMQRETFVSQAPKGDAPRGEIGRTTTPFLFEVTRRVGRSLGYGWRFAGAILSKTDNFALGMTGVEGTRASRGLEARCGAHRPCTNERVVEEAKQG